jgi:NAD+ synthase
MDIKMINDLQNWIKDYVASAHSKGVVLGMSGGKDSLIVAKLCINALGNQNVFGVIMPNGEMKDFSDAQKTCELLEMPYTVINIADAYDSVIENTKKVLEPMQKQISSVSLVNTAPRIRMTTLYSIAASLGYLVANTSNLSEAMTGYTTKWGDNVGDFAPIANFTKTEVCKMGELLGLPYDLVFKKPSNGLTGKTDEDNMGITYDELDLYIREGKIPQNYERIQKLFNISNHKRNGIAKFENNLPNHFFN